MNAPSPSPSPRFACDLDELRELLLDALARCPECHGDPDAIGACPACAFDAPPASSPADRTAA